MLTMKRAFKNIWRRRFRTALVGIVLALCVAIFASTLASVDASKTTTAAMLDQYESAAQSTIEQTEAAMNSIQISAGGFGVFTFGGPPGQPSGTTTSVSEDAATSTNDSISADIVDAIAAMDGVESMSGSLTYTVGATTTNSSGGGMMMMRFDYDYMINGITVDGSSDSSYSNMMPVNIVEGRNLQESDDKVVVIGQDLEDYFNAGVGDTIDIEGTEFTIVGIYASEFDGSSPNVVTSGQGDRPDAGNIAIEREDKNVYMRLATAQELLDMDGEVSSLTVYATDSSAVDDLVATIQSAYPDLTVFAYKDMQAQFGSFIEQQQQSIIDSTQGNLSSIESLGLEITIISAIVGVLLIFGLMFITVRERIKEIGTLKAIGFSNGEVMKQFMYEGMYVGLIGGIVGLALAAAASSGLSSWLINPSDTLGQSVSVHITALAIILGLVVAVLAGALGSLYPAWRASRVSPMESLRRE
jgi:putative ABC transport system permease protein